ncbi:MAG: HAD family hydrolase [Gemmatirosa sp.]
MLQAALFELEGVLVDTHAMRRDALRRALADEGVALTPGQYDAWCTGLSPDDAAAEAVRRLAPTTDAARALDDTARELVARRAERTFSTGLAADMTLTPGARAALDAMAGMLRLGLVTRARRREVDGVLALAGLEAHFACIVTADDVRVPRPAPDAHRLALARLAARGGAAPAATVAFENDALGVAAARAAGVRTVRVASSAHRTSEADGRGASPDAWIATLAGLTPSSLAALLDLAPASP